MSELAYKRRIRTWKRRIVTTLTDSGYEASSFDTGPFHVCADRYDGSRRIRIVFGSSTRSDVESVSRSPLPANCFREIWQIDDDGKGWVVAKVSGKLR